MYDTLPKQFSLKAFGGISMSSKKQRGGFRLPALTAIIVCLILFFVYFLFFTEHGLLPVYTQPLESQTAEIHVIDVGQGDSILLRSGDTDILIDAGQNSSEDKLISYLKGLDIKKLDMLVLTHPHEDHIGGADGVVQNFEIGTLLMPDAVSGSKTFEKLLDELEAAALEVTVPKRGDIFVFGDFTFTVLAPDSKTYKETNNYSIVLRADYGDTAFMLTGDAEALSESEMLEYFTVSELDCDLLKVGHHGSSTSSSETFINAVSPELAAISCGADNKYGHPHPDTTARLAEAGASISRTDEDGNLVYVSDGKRIKLKEY